MSAAYLHSPITIYSVYGTAKAIPGLIIVMQLSRYSEQTTGLTTEESWFGSRQSQTVQTGSGSHPAPYPHPLVLFSAENQNGWSCTFAHPYTFMVWTVSSSPLIQQSSRNYLSLQHLQFALRQSMCNLLYIQQCVESEDQLTGKANCLPLTQKDHKARLLTQILFVPEGASICRNFLGFWHSCMVTYCNACIPRPLLWRHRHRTCAMEGWNCELLFMFTGCTSWWLCCALVVANKKTDHRITRQGQCCQTTVNILDFVGVMTACSLVQS